MESIFTGNDMSELFPNPWKSAGTSSAPERSAFSPTSRGEAAFPFPHCHWSGQVFLCLLLRRAGRSSKVPLGVASSSCKGQG